MDLRRLLALLCLAPCAAVRSAAVRAGVHPAARLDTPLAAPRVSPRMRLRDDALRFGVSAALAAALCLSPVGAVDSSEGFEQFAAQGGVMKANPSCFFEQCGQQSKACFSNPACLKGITCLGNCRGEQLCATQCFARFGSEKLDAWLGCTLEDNECVSTGVKQDTSAFYADAPPVAPNFKPEDLEGKWFKVLGYNPKYDTYPCQTNTFSKTKSGGLTNDLVFSVPNPKGGPAWQNKFVEQMDFDKGPQGKASMTVEGKMFGLTFHEQWYSIGKGEGYHIVAYKGDTQQGPYEGAFVFARDRDFVTSPNGVKLMSEMNAQIARAGLDPKLMLPIDNSCPESVTAGASATDDIKEKLEWKDVFELTEWFRPGTLKKDANFDPNKM
ncbi:hypothetical protein AB1Y20_002003 [Prymnesium parvum]|uniref:VDE lipocalin domain-containing protein n=1 Tax=Prymnesium parvum TaxID=97485 RepID=A0AB34J7T9_PRYPA